MSLLRTKVWSWIDIALLKWSCLLVGAIAGAYFPELFKSYVWLVMAAAILLAVRPAVAYFARSKAG
jgi:hypothetical protein